MKLYRNKLKLDKMNLNLLKKFKWYISTNGYVVSYKNKKTIYLHRLVINAKKGQIVDHINTDKLDNRIVNLRVVSKSQNGMNKPSNGYSFNKRLKKWESYIQINKKKIHLGFFSTKQKAIELRKKAEVEYFKQYRYGAL